MLSSTCALVLFLQISALPFLAEGMARETTGSSGPIVTKEKGKTLDKFGKPSASSFEHTPTLGSLKRSVFRITVYRKVWRWSRPFDNHYVVGSLGSGFLVGDSPITIMTCAHVVRGADRVYIQVTDFGKTRFEAKVEIINNYADVALITLTNPKFFLEKLGKSNVALVPLRFAKNSPPLGHAVVAPGFPLGQETMTLSTGVISGTDHVSFHHTNLAIQSTAIISSGNSGSPLLDAESLEVIGMNYAKKTTEAQINYVVALWRLKQVLTKHKQVHGKGKITTPYQFRLVKPGLVLTPGVDALYQLSQSSQTCKSGPLISSVLPTSPFADASPPITENSFLVTVDGIKLDKYGQGTKKEYVDEMVDFSDLMYMRGGTGEEEIQFETCDAATGKVHKHKMSMAWSKKREGTGIQYVYDPRLDKLDWEIFGDLLFMPLTENHIAMFNGDFHYNAMIRFLDPAERQKPRLAVMLLRGGGEAADALDLMKGQDLEIVESINGHPVKDLEDYRKYFIPTTKAAKKGIKLLSSNSTRPTSQILESVSDPVLLPGIQSFLRQGKEVVLNEDQERKAVLKGEERVWALKTAAGKEHALLYVKTLRSQAIAYVRGERYVMTPGVKDAMLKQGFFKKKGSLLATPLGGSVETEMDVDAAMRVDGQPLEVIRREDGVAILDFAKNERYDSW